MDELQPKPDESNAYATDELFEKAVADNSRRLLGIARELSGTGLRLRM